MKTYFISCLFGLILLNSHAQQISGKINDENGSAIPFASVLLKHASDSSFYKGEVSDESGSFVFESVKNGKYHLEIRIIGFEHFSLADLNMNSNVVDLGEIRMKKSSDQLDEVSVTAEKPFIEKMADRTVVNIENSIVQSGSSVMEMLEKLPGVQVDQDGNIRLRGKQGVIVMIDNKPSVLAGQDLANLLRGMPAANVQKVEIITNPSAKYDASGNSGILNIITKRNKSEGYSGNITGGYGQGRYAKYNASSNFNYKKGRFSLFASYAFSERNGFVNLMLDRRFYLGDTLNATFNTDNYIKLNFKTYVPRIGADYKLSDKSTLSILASGSVNKIAHHAINHTDVVNGYSIRTGTFDFFNTTSDFNRNYEVNAMFHHRIDTVGQEFTLNFDHGNYLTKTDQDFSSIYHDDFSSIDSTEYNAGDQSGKLFLWSLKFDYTKPLKKEMVFEAGAKSSLVGSDKDMRFYDVIAETEVFDSSRSSHFLYAENINAAYINFSVKKGKWRLQSGLRAEHTHALGEQVLNGEKFDRNYVQIFPTVYINYEANGKNNFNINLGRRINRPHYEMMNPFKRLIDATTYSEGNPYLLPALTYAAEMSYSFKNVFFLTLNSDFTSDDINQILTQNSETRITIERPVNLEKFRFHSLHLTYADKLTKRWRTSTGIMSYYGHFTGNINSYSINRGQPSFFLNSSNSINIIEGLSMECNFSYYHKNLYGVTEMRSVYNFTIGVQKSVLKKQGTITVNCSDLFFRAWPTGVTEFGNVSEDWWSVRDTRVVNFSFTWKFGKGDTGRMRRETGADEEKNRMG